MMYFYEDEKTKLFTEEGQVMFLKIRDKAKHLLKLAGAFRMNEVIANTSGSSWKMFACVDRLVELGEIVEITRDVSEQYRVFVESW